MRVGQVPCATRPGGDDGNGHEERPTWGSDSCHDASWGLEGAVRGSWPCQTASLPGALRVSSWQSQSASCCGGLDGAPCLVCGARRSVDRARPGRHARALSLGDRTGRQHVNDWFAGHRTGLTNSLSLDLTRVADVPGIAIVATAVTVVLAVRRWGRISLFVAIGLVLELAVFELSEHVVVRPRPPCAASVSPRPPTAGPPGTRRPPSSSTGGSPCS